MKEMPVSYQTMLTRLEQKERRREREPAGPRPLKQAGEQLEGKVPDGVRRGLERIPGVGVPMFRFVEKFRDWVKTPFVDGKFFDALGFRYIGPLDGHDLKTLIRIFRRAKEDREPQILHVVTVKGKGYTPAESHPDAYHGVAPFLVETGEMRGEKNASAIFSRFPA